MTVAQNAIGQNEKPAPIRVRPGLWINITRPGYYMGNPPEVSRKEFDRLFHNNPSVKPLRWDYKSLSARSCGLRLKWHRDDANSSLIFDDNNRLVAGEVDSLEPNEEGNWSCDKSARAGDLSLFYRTAPAMDIRYLLLIKGNAEATGCDCVVAYKFQEPLPLKDIRQTGVYIRQTTVIPVDAVDWRHLNEMLAERNPSYPEEIREKLGVDIFTGIPLSAAESPAMDENASVDSLDSWTASPATYERLTRPEQRKFRERVIRAYGGSCAITGESCNAVLEAAHLPGRDHTQHNLASDGILLRIDLHRLLDTGLMTFTAKGIIQISREAGAEYRKLNGQIIRFPKRKVDYPTL